MPLNFPIYSTELGAKLLEGLKTGASLKEQTSRQKYLEPSLQEELIKSQLANKKSQLLMPFVEPGARAELASLQQDAPHKAALVRQILEGTLPLQKKEIQWYDPKASSQIDEIREKIREGAFRRQNPLLGASGLAGQIGAMIHLQQHPELGSGQIEGQAGRQMEGQPLRNQGSLADMLKAGIAQEQHNKSARANYLDKMSQSMAYRSLPIDQKTGLIAQASGMGYDPAEAATKLMEGKSIFQLAEEKGFDRRNMPDPIYPAGAKERAMIQQRKAASAEIDSVMPEITKAIAPYARKLGNYSVKDLMDAFSTKGGSNISGSDINRALSSATPTERQKFLGAMIVMPEISGVRFRAMAGAQLGIEAIKSITESSLSNIKIPGLTISPEDYMGAQNYANKLINTMVGAANKANARGYSQSAQSRSSETSEFSEEDIRHTAKEEGISVEEVKRRLDQIRNKKKSNLEDQLGQLSQQIEGMQLNQGMREEY
jgi:hypothetical protein